MRHDPPHVEVRMPDCHDPRGRPPNDKLQSLQYDPPKRAVK